jgi:prepilin-type N-terminal cleavage/methylation domain-containing protein
MKVMATHSALARSSRAELLRNSQAGFSLIEILVAMALLSILAGAGAAVSMRVLRGNLAERTVLRMRAVMTAILGDSARATSGYLGDMGEPPTDLRQLFEAAGQQAAVVDPTDGIVSGYNGPYILEGIENGVGIRDFWGTPLVVGPGTLQLTSFGPDRQPAGGDDIVVPAVQPVIAGAVTVIVKGMLNDGGPPISLRSDEAQVRITYTRPDTNQRDDATVSYSGPQGSGIWRTAAPTAALHLGDHAVLVTGRDGPPTAGRDFSLSVAREIVHIDRSSVHVTVLLDEAP